MNVEQSLDGDRGGDLHLKVPAAAAQLVSLRHALAQWATRVGMADEDVEALVLASYEAMANSVEHAYRDQTGYGVLEVRGQVSDSRVVVTVTDYGQWQPPRPTRGLRGRGLPLIQGLTGSATITPSEAGTTVSMTWPLARRG